MTWGGVLIAHHPEGIEYTASSDWCARYEQEFGLSQCTDQHPRIDLDGNSGHSSVWFVLAAWLEERTFTACEFGLGEYDAGSYLFLDQGPCFPAAGLELPSTGWPAPNEGVALTTTSTPWSGNYIPVYYFAGYAYGTDVIPLAVNPSTGSASFAREESPPVVAPVADLGAMGLFEAGRYVCPPDLEQQVIAMFLPGVISFPSGMDQGPIGDVTISSPLLDSLLTASDVQLIAKAFPEFEPGDTLALSRKGELVRLADLSTTYRMQLGTGDRAGLLQDLGGLEGVVYAERNITTRPCGRREPDDPAFQAGYQWALDPESGYNVGAVEAWDVTTGSPSITVGVLDGGVEEYHPDLQGRVVGDLGYAWGGHGFATAGVIGANTDNYFGMAGLDWCARMSSRRVDGRDAPGIADAIRGALLADNASVLNNSWSIDPPGEMSFTIRLALADAYRLNAIATAATCNDQATTPQYPAAYDHGIIAVAAVDRHGTHWPWSNRGDYVDLVAPGDAVYSCYPTSSPVGAFDYYSGTTMAAAHVAGAASLLLAANSALSNDDIQHLLELSTDRAGMPSGHSTTMGWGRLKVDGALARLRSPYSFQQITGTDGTEVGSTGQYQMIFFDTPGLTDGRTYLVTRHEVRQTIQYTFPFSADVHVWCRGADMNDGGFSQANPNLGFGWCETVGEVLLDRCTVRTYVYDVHSFPENRHIRWSPCEPEDVRFEITANGVGTSTGVSDLSAGECFAPRLKVPSPVRPGGIAAELEVAIPTHATVEVFDVLGRRTELLWDDGLPQGRHSFRLSPDANTARSAGVYFVRLTTSEARIARPLIVLR